MALKKIFFEDDWLHTARTLEGDGWALLLEAIIHYQLYGKQPPRDINKEALGAFKAIKVQIDRELEPDFFRCELTDSNGEKLC